MSEHEKEHSSCGCCHEHTGCCCSHEHENDESGVGTWIRLGASFLLAVCGILISLFTDFVYLPITVYATAYIVAGFEVLYGAVKGIIKGDVFGENFLMSIASLGAFAIGEYAEACAVMLLFELGEKIQDMAVDKSRGSIRAMLELRPERIILIRDGKEIEARAEAAHIGDLILVKPGEKIPCDGEIVDGCGDVDMSSLTGESIPVSKGAGDSVLAGSISIDGTLRIRVTEEYDNSTVAKILEMLENAKAKKSRTESFISRFARIYTPIVCLVSTLIVVIPTILGGDFGVWLYRGLCALAASCPCALVISVPLGFFSGLGSASREGVLIKGSNYLEALSKVDTAVFDKTGTLTYGRFSLIGEENVSDSDKFHFALAVCEKYSTHPIANKINELFGYLAENAESASSNAIHGRGVRTVCQGKEYIVGNALFMRESGIDYIEATLLGSSVYAAEDGTFLGSATFFDVVKEDSKAALGELFELGIGDSVMLTGDKCEIAEKIAKEVGIEKVYSELLPSDKAKKLEEIKSGEKRTVYVGDGINDAPVLALADVGVAMGGIGSAAALEAADAVIMGDSLKKLPAAIKTARCTMRIVRQNIVFSLFVKILVVILSAIGAANLWLAVFADVGVCLIAVLNSLRIMKK